MITQQQQRVLYFLMLTTLIVWITGFAMLMKILYKPSESVAYADAPQKVHTSTPDGTHLSTWTPTISPTPTEINTIVPTYPHNWLPPTPTPKRTPHPKSTPGTQPQIFQSRQEAMDKYRPIFKEVATKFNLDPELMLVQAYFESSLNPKAQGLDDDMGIMQIIPSTWDEVAPTVGSTDPWDAHDNIMVGAAYLAHTQSVCRELDAPYISCMLLAYNWGPYNVRQLYARGETWRDTPGIPYRYVSDILEAYGGDKPF
ncbi:MAG: hypothetical protein B6242_08215 [Anaerolineaceae bacterium 4572_78]|nr:MAG: hypothetical protein B6242_08215 [Anaerolineaceae bacterium 4572_78]